MELERLIEFVQFTHQIRSVERAIRVHGSTRAENDMEHMFQVALVAWFINERRGLGFDTGKLLQLALVHDLLEVHAGDTNAYASAKHLATKADREAAAITALKAQWPDFPVIHQLIAEYESLSTPESRFVYSLDKLITIINNYTDQGASWHSEQISLADVKQAKASKVDRDPTIAAYYADIMEVLAAHPELFPPRS